MNRREFLAGILAACAAPAIVRAESLMPIRQVWKRSSGGVLLIEEEQMMIAMFSSFKMHPPKEVVVPISELETIDKFILSEGVFQFEDTVMISPASPASPAHAYMQGLRAHLRQRVR